MSFFNLKDDYLTYMQVEYQEKEMMPDTYGEVIYFRYLLLNYR